MTMTVTTLFLIVSSRKTSQHSHPVYREKINLRGIGTYSNLLLFSIPPIPSYFLSVLPFLRRGFQSSPPMSLQCSRDNAPSFSKLTFDALMWLQIQAPKSTPRREHSYSLKVKSLKGKRSEALWTRWSLSIQTQHPLEIEIGTYYHRSVVLHQKPLYSIGTIRLCLRRRGGLKNR